MTRLERHKEKLAALEAKRNQMMRQGRYPQMQELEEDLKEIRKLIAEAEEYEAKPIKELLTMDEIHASGIMPLIMECHLAADYLNDCAYMLKERIRSLGFNAVSLVPEMKEILKKSEAFASILCKKNKQLSDMLIDNDTLLSALHKKTLSYIEQRMKHYGKS